jgi:hypothetical protein
MKILDRGRAYWYSWCGLTIVTGILAGFMISQSLMLGPFFTWFVESDNTNLMRETYSVYRAGGTFALRYTLYYLPLLLSLIFGGIWTVLAFLRKTDRIIAVIAGLSTYWVSALFIGTGFMSVEEATMKGLADDATFQRFASLNVPLHSTFAIIYSVSLVLLLVVAIRRMGISSS